MMNKILMMGPFQNANELLAAFKDQDHFLEQVKLAYYELCALPEKPELEAKDI